MEYATLVQRILAGLIDALIVGVIYFCVTIVFGGIGGVLGGSGSDSAAAAGAGIGLIGTCLGVIIILGYYIYMEGSSGQTIGKKAMKIKVTKDDGSPCDMGAAAIRRIVGIVDALPTAYIIGIILIATSAKKQRLGDMVAKTIVVPA